MKIININYFTWYLLLISFLCGYINIALIVLFIVLMHELGHIILIKLFGYKIRNVTIYPFGGIVKIKKDINSSLNKELLIACGGVMMQLILFLIVPNFLVNYNLKIFLNYNLSIMLFNLIPIIPLDGSIILNSILNKLFPYKLSLKISNIISIIFIIIYLIINYYLSLNNFMIVGLFIYKTYLNIKNSNYLFNKFLLERYLNKYHFKYLSTRKGNLDILKIDTYQYFKENEGIISEGKKLKSRFDK